MLHLLWELWGPESLIWCLCRKFGAGFPNLVHVFHIWCMFSKFGASFPPHTGIFDAAAIPPAAPMCMAAQLGLEEKHRRFHSLITFFFFFPFKLLIRNLDSQPAQWEKNPMRLSGFGWSPEHPSENVHGAGTDTSWKGERVKHWHSLGLGLLQFLMAGKGDRFPGTSQHAGQPLGKAPF